MKKSSPWVKPELPWSIFRDNPLKSFFTSGKDVLHLSYKKGFVIEVRIKKLEDYTGEEVDRCDICSGSRQVKYVISEAFSSGYYCRTCRNKYNIASIADEDKA